MKSPKDDNKKSTDEWSAKAGRARSLQSKVVYALCLGAAVCTLLIWGMNTYVAEKGASEGRMYGPKKMTPEQVQEQLAKVARELQHVYNTSKPFTKFGPPVVDWDKTRADAIRKSTNSTSGVNPKPRVLLVTSSHPKKCENKQGDQMLLKSIKNKMDYCRLHGIEIFYNMDKIDPDMVGWWVKVFLTHMLMKQHPEVDWIWWMDSDAIFTDMTFEIPWEKYKNHNMIMHGWEDAVYEKRSWLGLNAGVYLIRNCQWSMDLLHAWAPMSPKGAIRNAIGKLQSKALPDRPQGQADDQSGLVYLMIADREKWGSKVYLESSYYFQGYWKVITEKFEEMMEKYKPGIYGDDRWPFVTHFCGCEFCCGAINPEYTVDRCLTNMERAINFADNQVVGLYGFQHKSLASVEVVPKLVTKNETTTSKPRKTEKAKSAEKAKTGERPKAKSKAKDAAIDAVTAH